MSSRYVMPAALAMVVIGFIAYVVVNSDWEEVTVPAPLRGEAVTNPFYGLQELVETLGAESEWRDSLGDLPPNDGVVFLSHWHWDLMEHRRDRLEEWVNDGGRVVLDRTLIGGEEHLQSWAGIGREDHAVTREEMEAKASGESCKTLRAGDDNALETSARAYRICELDAFSHLTAGKNITWEIRDNHGLQAVRVRIGRGSVTAINGEPFGNRDLLKEDHARLFAAAAQLRRGDRVIFISEREHTSLLGLMWIYGGPVIVLFLLVFAALLWRGGVRFGPLAAAPDLARRSIAEQIRGTGLFTIRLGGGKALHAAAVRALDESARRRLTGYAGATHADRVEAIARAAGMDHNTLADAINHAGPRRERELAQTLALLESARRKIIDTNA